MQLNPVKTKYGVQGWGFCYKNWHAMPLVFVLSRLGIKVKALDNLPVVKTTFENFQSKMWSLKDTVVVDRPLQEYDSMDMSNFIPVIPATGWSSNRTLKYLKGRGFTEQQVIQYQLLCDPIGDYINRVIVPFFEDNKPVYFQARDITGLAELKVLNPQAKSDVGKSCFLFNLDQARDHDSVIICEGWASAMSAGYNSVAISGKVASDRQKSLLKRYWKKYLIMLDADAKKEALALACELIPYGTVDLVLLGDGDPNDYSAEDLDSFKSHAVRLRSVTEAKLFGVKAKLI